MRKLITISLTVLVLALPVADAWAATNAATTKIVLRPWMNAECAMSILFALTRKTLQPPLTFSPHGIDFGVAPDAIVRASPFTAGPATSEWDGSRYAAI